MCRNSLFVLPQKTLRVTQNSLIANYDRRDRKPRFNLLFQSHDVTGGIFFPDFYPIWRYISFPVIVSNLSGICENIRFAICNFQRSVEPIAEDLGNFKYTNRSGSGTQ